MSIIAFIFARGGSKGLPNKNILPFAGKPLIAWSIDQALTINRINRVVVSTDSEDIASVARSFGAETPFRRPADIAQDDTPEWLAWRHALETLHRIDGAMPDVMISLPATAPLRHSVDIENCLDKFQEGDSDIVVTVNDSQRNPYFNMVKLLPDNTVDLIIRPERNIVRRQDAPEIFDMNTVAYVTSPDYVMSSNGIFDGKVKHVHVPVERSVDIDTIYDFKFAEYIYLNPLI